jgi:Type III restriction enzyme, res subunit
MTIYDKLVADFTQNTEKYVFKGIAEFVQMPPIIVTGDTWDQGRGLRGSDLFGETAVVNIFNVDKINKDAGRIKKLHEYIGQSYFDYLAELPDLVLLMDEAHRYRAKAGMKAVAELNPVLGLELTATPRSVGAKSVPFKNVVFDYGLGQAMADGFVKEPAVATRKDFRPESVTPEQLERIKLEDGIHCHENTKAELDIYSRQSGRPLVLTTLRPAAIPWVPLRKAVVTVTRCPGLLKLNFDLGCHFVLRTTVIVQLVQDYPDQAAAARLSGRSVWARSNRSRSGARMRGGKGRASMGSPHDLFKIVR